MSSSDCHLGYVGNRMLALKTVGSRLDCSDEARAPSVMREWWVYSNGFLCHVLNLVMAIFI